MILDGVSSCVWVAASNGQLPISSRGTGILSELISGVMGATSWIAIGSWERSGSPATAGVSGG